MSTATAEKWSILSRNDDEMRRSVNMILKEAEQVRSTLLDRRVDKRVAFPNLVQITPIADHGMEEAGQPIHVVGKFLAERGFDFFHTENLPFRRGIVSLIPSSESAARFILNLSWSRFLQPGWYDSGGRFTHLVQQTEPVDFISE